MTPRESLSKSLREAAARVAELPDWAREAISVGEIFRVAPKETTMKPPRQRVFKYAVTPGVNDITGAIARFLSFTIDPQGQAVVYALVRDYTPTRTFRIQVVMTGEDFEDGAHGSEYLGTAQPERGVVAHAFLVRGGA